MKRLLYAVLCSIVLATALIAIAPGQGAAPYQMFAPIVLVEREGCEHISASKTPIPTITIDPDVYLRPTPTITPTAVPSAYLPPDATSILPTATPWLIRTPKPTPTLPVWTPVKTPKGNVAQP